MRDITAPESFRWRRFVDVFEHTVGLAGYDLVIPPLLEDIGVFTRLGEATDVVTKEMYDFVDKGEAACGTEARADGKYLPQFR